MKIIIDLSVEELQALRPAKYLKLDPIIEKEWVYKFEEAMKTAKIAPLPAEETKIEAAAGESAGNSDPSIVPKRGGAGGHASFPMQVGPKEPEPSDLLEPEPSTGGKNKKKLDDGKIFALRSAGWTFEKIADEMNCSTQTALNHYNAYIRNMSKEQA